MHGSCPALLRRAAGSGVPWRKIGGRLAIPVGADQRVRELVRVTRVSENEYRSEYRKVRRARARRALRPVSREEETLVRNLADAPESFPSVEGLISIP